MQKSHVLKMLEGRALILVMALLSLPAVVNATTYNGLYSSVLNNASNTSGIACTSCHLSSLVGATDRHAATDGADFDDYDASLARAGTMIFYVDPANYPDGMGGFDAYMPMDPNQADYTYLGVANLLAADRNLIQDWIDDGLPLDVPTASNVPVALPTISRTGATLRGTANTNVHAATTVPGTYYFEYGISGVNFSSGGAATALDLSVTSNTSVNSAIIGLTCETTYQYRLVVTNGDSSDTGSPAATFKTDNCVAPTIRRNLVNAGVGESYSVAKGSSLDNAADFLLDATDTDGTAALSWTLDGGQPAAGVATVSGTGATATITYTVPANVPAPDTVTFDVLVSDDSNDGVRTDRVTISIQIVDSPPVITNIAQPETITVLEDDPDGDSVTLTATDADGDTLTWSVVGGTEPVNGTLNIFGTGTSQVVTYTPIANIDIDENFTVRVSDGTGASDIVVNVDVTALPDPPVALDDPGFEVLVNSINNTLDVLVNDTDVDTGDTKTLAIQSITGSQGGTIIVNNAGMANNTLDYSPAAGVTVAETFIYTVTDSAGLTDTALVTVSPPDTDGDGVVDYIDNCAATANGAAGDNQADNDGDQLINVNTTTDPADPLIGGDACDTDDDNDGILDSDELLYPGCLDPFDAADATQDCDGDGIDNITEVNDGDPNTNPDEDSVGPAVIAPVDITVDATGLLTVVNTGVATGNDGNDGEVAIFKAAVNLTAAQLAALDDPVSGCDVLSAYETDIKPFRPGSHTVTWATCDSSSNPGRDEQIINVRPLVSVTSGQSVGEGQSVTIPVMLNGDAIAYPATVRYAVTGTAAAGDDHDASSGTVTFNAPGEIAVITFNTLTDAITEDDENVIITLHAPVNIALANVRRHVVTIAENNIAPQAVFIVTQPAAARDTSKGNTLYVADGLVQIVANAFDGNGDTLSYDWSATDSNLLNAAGTVIAGNQLDFDPNALTVGSFYKVSVTVTDGSAPVTIERLLMIKSVEINTWLVGDDADGDGIDNLDEGYGDDDADGIANYLDDVSLPANAIQNHTADLDTSMLIETDPGLHIALGETAVAAQISGVQLGLQDIKDHGAAGGGAVSNAATEYTFLSSLLNFEISGLTDNIVSAHVVIPLSSAIQAEVVYRKYNRSGWFDFVIDDLNQIHSATGDDGSCPQPGSNRYISGLTPGHLCLQLTIQDGGANDADGVRNYVVKDPGGLALAPAVEVAEAESGGSGRVGSVSLWFMLTLSIFIVGATVIRRPVRR